MASLMPMDESVMITLTADLFGAGKQTAHQVHLIMLGEKPADIPVEIAEFFLIINLNTAEKIGIHVPDNILSQANTIIR